ncbi:uncharacterized protein ACNLHF_022340 [Anomaloglossus baeobatrachus]
MEVELPETYASGEDWDSRRQAQYKQIQMYVEESLDQTRERQERNFNKQAKAAPFAPGEIVLKRKRKQHKLEDQWEKEPYVIQPSNFDNQKTCLISKDDGRTTATVSRDHLKKCPEPLKRAEEPQSQSPVVERRKKVIHTILEPKRGLTWQAARRSYVSKPFQDHPSSRLEPSEAIPSIRRLKPFKDKHHILEEMVSYTNWNKEPKDCEGKMTSSLLEKEHLPKLKTSFYVMGSTFLLLCFIFVIVYMLHQGTIVNDVNEQTREIQHSRRPRGSDTRNLLTEDITDNSVEITGNICMGYGTKCCIELHFIHDTDIILHAIAGPKTRFTQLQGEYVHNNKTGTWECSPTDVLYWNIEIRGDEPAVWSGDITNDMIAKGKFGRSKTEILLKTQVFGKILDPSLLSITEGDKDWVKTWNFQITQEPVQVQRSDW